MSDSRNVLNQTQFAYNGFHQVIREFQEHGGAVNTMTSPRVEYAYANGTANTTRRVAMVYPDGRVLSYDYGTAGGQGDRLSRVESLVDDDTTHLADYTYLGLGGIVRVDSPEPDVRYDLATGSGATTYAGLDQFDRTATCLWQGDLGGTPTDIVKLGYTYDRVSNRLTREDHVAKAQMTPQYFDEKYSYDGLYRLVDFERGQLSAGSITSRNFRQNWQELTSPFDTALDPTGNWTAFNQNDDGQGAWELEQSRQHNQANEITDIDESAGTAWPTLSYDDAGNTTSFPQPAALANSYAATYDAWHRLVRLADGADTVAAFAYDGSNRRMTKGEYAGGVLERTRHFYYSDGWQNLEERVDDEAPGSSSSSSSSTSSGTPAQRQFVWGLRYIDDLVLRDRASLDERIYALQDDNWNVVSAVDDTGTVQQRYAYQAYGQPIFLTATFTSGSPTALEWETLFAGYRFDADVALYCVRHRYLHSPLGRWVSRDPIGLTVDTNLYLHVGDDPANATDPNGLWRFVRGMGTLSGSLGPGEESAYGKASSAFLLQFDRDADAFRNNRNSTCCAEIRFIQIFYMRAKAISTMLPNKTWTIDSDSPPYYPHGFFRNPSDPMSVPSTMTDDPHFSTLWRYSRPSGLSMDFETCAVCAKSKPSCGKRGVGDVFACVEWGHSFQIAGSVLTVRVRDWKRYVESEVWTSFILVVGGRNSPKRDFKDVAAEPSGNMRGFLDKYFP